MSLIKASLRRLAEGYKRVYRHDSESSSVPGLVEGFNLASVFPTNCVLQFYRGAGLWDGRYIHLFFFLSDRCILNVDAG